MYDDDRIEKTRSAPHPVSVGQVAGEPFRRIEILT